MTTQEKQLLLEFYQVTTEKKDIEDMKSMVNATYEQKVERINKCFHAQNRIRKDIESLTIDIETDSYRIPLHVKSVLSTYNDEAENLYNECIKINRSLNRLGWICEYGLEGIPVTVKQVKNRIIQLTSVGNFIDMANLRVYTYAEIKSKSKLNKGIYITDMSEEWHNKLSKFDSKLINDMI